MQGKNFVVIGGSSGIGLGIVERLANRGAQVVVVSRQAPSSGLTGVSHIACDVVAESLNIDSFPEKIHGLAYCPGSINLGSLRSLSADTLRSDFELNVVAAVRSVQTLLPALNAAGMSSVVLFSTVAVQTGFAMHTSVAAAKGALEGITRSWAAELAPRIRVNCIAPALTNSPLATRLLDNDQKKKAMASMYPLQRYGEVEDVASIGEFLLTDISSWMTGQIIRVDGGISSIRK